WVEEKSAANLFLELKQTEDPQDDFSLQKEAGKLHIAANSARGLQYGIMDMAEQMSNGKTWADISPKEVKAHYPFRAIKFNLPWFSYRSGEHLALHEETCRDLAYWEAFLDMMVENKFNALTLWNLHPYIYMVKPTSFPEASPFTDAEMAEWQQFWKALFKMAKLRGIETYIVNWNIFISEPFAKAHNIGGYSNSKGFWGEGETNELVEQYTREIVTQTINEYEDLTGIGITLGERMGGMTSEQRRDWIDRTMIAGLKAANREAKLIYRAPLSAGTTSHGTTSVSTEKLTREALETMELENEILVEFKFNWSHAHSSPKVSIVHGGILTDTYWQPEPTKYKGVWTMRNEDFHMLRWAQPDFIRAFMGYNSQSYIGGCIIGSEVYIPAKDYLTQEAYRSWDYAFERQWLFYKVWGNLLYNAETPDTYFEQALARKFALKSGHELLNAWKLASMNANYFASFHQGTWDATIYTEGFTTVGGKFIDIDKFIDHPVLDSGYVNIPDFLTGNYAPDQLTPDKLADLTEAASQDALEIATQLRRQHPDNQDLIIELTDIETWAYYGFYFAAKIRGGIALHLFRTAGDKADQTEAISQLEKGVTHWQKMVELVETYNVPVFPYQFDPEFSWRKHLESVNRDVKIAKGNN
ncbi:MAG: hypothetical protein AAFV07_14830, partial [Bacteroidota bacterium]